MLRWMLLAAAGGSGSFTAPPPSGTGILSIGSITTITDDTYYNSWPGVAKRANGDLITVYSKNQAHFGNNNGQPDYKVRTAGTWGSEGFFADDPSLKVVPNGVTVLSSGREIVPLWRDDEGVSGSGEAGIIYSDDGWATDSGWIDLTTGFDGQAFAAGPVVELPGGDLLVTVEGSYTGDPILNRGCHTLRSTDDGATWGDEVIVRDYDTRPYYESVLVLLDTAELIVVHRCSAGTGTHYIQRSADQGATDAGWYDPYSAFDGYARPGTIQGTSGTLLSVTRRNSDAAAIAYTSTDLGLSWGSAYVLDDTMEEMEYGWPVEISMGEYVVVYGSQPTSSISNSDIKQVEVTETLA